MGGTRYRVRYSDGRVGGGFTGVFIPIVRSVALEMDSASPGTPTVQSFVDDLTLTGGSPANGTRFYRICVVW